MKTSLKSQLAKSLGGNMELNKKAIHMKKSWDEVNSMIGKGHGKKSKDAK